MLGLTKGMLIERATAADLTAVAALVNLAYRGEEAAAGWTSEASFLAGQRTDVGSLEADLATGKPCILMLRDAPASPLLGCVRIDASVPGVCELGMLSVSPDGQNRGIGKALIAAGIDLGRQAGATRLRITVIQIRDALIAWYERQGFVRTGETEAFPYGDQRFGIPLRDDLYFVVLEKPI